MTHSGIRPDITSDYTTKEIKKQRTKILKMSNAVGKEYEIILKS